MNRYKIEWHYTDGSEIYTTHVKCTHRNVKSALKRFHFFFDRIHDDDRDFTYIVVSVVPCDSVIS